MEVSDKVGSGIDKAAGMYADMERIKWEGAQGVAKTMRETVHALATRPVQKTAATEMAAAVREAKEQIKMQEKKEAAVRSARAARRRRRSMRPASAAALSVPLAVPERVRAPRFAPSIHEKHRLGLSPVHTQAASQLREAEPRLGCEHKGRYHVPPHETLVQQRMIHRSIAKAPGGVLTEHRVKGLKTLPH